MIDLIAIRARDEDDYATAEVLRNIQWAGNTDPELTATINMVADRHALLAAYDALAAENAALRENANLVARLAEAERNEGTLLGMIRHQRDVLRECLPYLNESMAGKRPGRSADDIRAAVKALTTDSTASQPESPPPPPPPESPAKRLIHERAPWPFTGKARAADQPDAALEQFARDLAAAQQPLDPVAAKVLRENLHDLYMDNRAADNASVKCECPPEGHAPRCPNDLFTKLRTTDQPGEARDD